MKKILAVALFMMFWAVPAMAQLSVGIDINVGLDLFINNYITVDTYLKDAMTIDTYKEIDIIVYETITKDKNVDIDVNVDLETDKAAEAIAVVKAVNDKAGACENCSEKKADILDSIKGNVGIVNVNQASGFVNNQGNVISLAVDVEDGNGTNGTNGTKSFVEAMAVVEQANLVSFNNTEQTPILFPTIYDSIKGNTGIVNVNQSVGNTTNQHNVLAIAVAFNAGVALSEADLGQVNSLVIASDFVVNRFSTINDSIKGNTGIVNVNQNAGALNNQANVLSIAATRF